MDISKARELSDQELLTELVSARRHLYDLRFQLATRQLSDYSQIAQTRRSIARLLTVQTEREFGGAAAAGVGARSRREVMSAVAGAHHGEAQDQGRPRGLRQDGQDHRGLGGAPQPPPAVQARHPADHAASRRTTSATRRASVTRCASRSPGRCPPPSAGAWSRSCARASAWQHRAGGGLRGRDRGGHPRRGPSRP